MQKLILAGLLLALTACATNGPKIEAARLSELRKGVTTAKEIYKEFGQPNFLSKNIDGTQTAVYVHTAESNSAPVLGIMSAQSETVTFSFDAKGVLADFKYSGAAATARETTPVAQNPAPVASRASPPPAGTVQSGAESAGAAKSPAKKEIPYLWDILRSSTARDPRGQ